jgi:hypothetical protein
MCSQFHLAWINDVSYLLDFEFSVPDCFSVFVLYGSLKRFIKC